MRFRLDMYDVDFQIKIKQWIKPTHENIKDDLWTITELYLKGKYIDYFTDCEMMLNWEVEELKNTLGKLINGELKEDEEVNFCEPDLTFLLFPAKRLYNTQKVIYAAKGYIDVETTMDLRVHFWGRGGLGRNFFSMTFDLEEIIAFYTYLCMVTGEIKKDDDRVLKLLSSGIILPE